MELSRDIEKFKHYERRCMEIEGKIVRKFTVDYF